jgi:hypothetical protein
MLLALLIVATVACLFGGLMGLLIRPNGHRSVPPADAGPRSPRVSR